MRHVVLLAAVGVGELFRGPARNDRNDRNKGNAHDLRRERDNSSVSPDNEVRSRPVAAGCLA
jgi:hypothetical protein